MPHHSKGQSSTAFIWLAEEEQLRQPTQECSYFFLNQNLEVEFLALLSFPGLCRHNCNPAWFLDTVLFFSMAWRDRYSNLVAGILTLYGPYYDKVRYQGSRLKSIKKNQNSLNFNQNFLNGITF